MNDSHNKALYLSGDGGFVKLHCGVVNGQKGGEVVYFKPVRRIIAKNNSRKIMESKGLVVQPSV